MTRTPGLRQQLARLLTWSDAHISFDAAVAGLPVAARGKVPRDLLAPVPAGTGQTLLRAILLAADHAAYHVGQLVAVRRLLGCWP